MEKMWLLILIAFVVAEVATSMSLVSIWFCVGAIAAMFAANAGLDFIWQLSIFVVVSAVALILSRPLVKKIKPKREATNLDAIIDKIAVVTVDIDNSEAKGEIKIDGKFWKAKSVNDTDINEGEKVKIVKIQGVTAFVERMDV